MGGGRQLRIPVVTKGDSVSKGTMFLLTVISASAQRFFSLFPGYTLASQVYQNQVVVGSAAYKVIPKFREFVRPLPWHCSALAADTILNFGFQGFLIGNSFTRNDMP